MRTILPAAALAGAVAVGGCGSSGPSREEFAKRADALCMQADRHAPQTAPRTAKEAVRYTRQQIDSRAALDAKLRKLAVPSSEKSDFAAFNADTARMISLLKQQNGAARNSDESGYDRLQLRFTTTAEQREKTAIELGFGVCGRGVTGRK